MCVRACVLRVRMRVRVRVRTFVCVHVRTSVRACLGVPRARNNRACPCPCTTGDQRAPPSTQAPACPPCSRTQRAGCGQFARLTSHAPTPPNPPQAVGEPPFHLGASVFFALKDAAYSARADAGLTGYAPLDAPATPERLRMMCGDALTQLQEAQRPGFRAKISC